MDVAALSLSSPPLTRHKLALYMAGSGDLNPLHVDTDVARAVGFDDVIAHGMLVAAMAARMIAQAYGQQNIKALEFRFIAPTQVHDSLDFYGGPVALGDETAGDIQKIEFGARTGTGTMTLAGHAIIYAAEK